MKRTALASITAALLSIAMSANMALALDGADFAQKLSATLEATGTVVTLDDVRTEGDTVTVGTFTYASAGDEPQKIDREIMFTGVAETGDGGYTAAHGKIAAFTFVSEKYSVEVGDMIVEDIRVPATPDPIANLTLYGRLHAGAISASTEGAEAFAIQSIDVTNKFGPQGAVLTGRFVAEGIHADLGKMGESAELATMQSFGLETIDARVTTENVWNVETGRLSVNQMALEIDKVGTLNGTATIEGYDIALLEELSALQRRMAKAKDASVEEREAMSMETLNKMTSTMHLAQADIRFEDDSITGKILSFFARQNGTTPEIMGAGFAATLPLMAGQFGLPPAAQTMLAEAAAEYLTSPENLTISVKPKAPVPLGDVVASLLDPARLVTLLNLDIRANQPVDVAAAR